MGAMQETRFTEETVTIYSRVMEARTPFMAGKGMTRSTEIKGLIGSGAKKEMTFFAASAPARQQAVAATESMEALGMTHFRGPTKKTLFTADLVMIH